MIDGIDQPFEEGDASAALERDQAAAVIETAQQLLDLVGPRDSESEGGVEQARRAGLRTEAALDAEREWHREVLAELQAEIAGLRRAMETRATIEQAKGILMGAEHCTADEAFDMLIRASQRENRRLALIATEIVERTVGQRSGDDRRQRTQGAAAPRVGLRP
jgi:hypothetical protein